MKYRTVPTLTDTFADDLATCTPISVESTSFGRLRKPNSIAQTPQVECVSSREIAFANQHQFPVKRTSNGDIVCFKKITKKIKLRFHWLALQIT